MKADQDLVCRVLKTRVGLVQLASRLARQLAELVTVGHMAQCPKNQIRTHYGYLLKKWLPQRELPVTASAAGNQTIPGCRLFPSCVIDARKRRPVQNL